MCIKRPVIDYVTYKWRSDSGQKHNWKSIGDISKIFTERLPVVGQVSKEKTRVYKGYDYKRSRWFDWT